MYYYYYGVVMKNLLFILFSAVFPVLFAVESGIVVANPSRSRIKKVVRVGIPFPAGVCLSAEKTAVFNGSKQLPTQTAVLSKWSDNSVRWMSADFEVELDGSDKQNFSVRTDVEKKIDGDKILC